MPVINHNFYFIKQDILGLKNEIEDRVQDIERQRQEAAAPMAERGRYLVNSSLADQKILNQIAQCGKRLATFHAQIKSKIDLLSQEQGLQKEEVSALQESLNNVTAVWAKTRKQWENLYCARAVYTCPISRRSLGVTEQMEHTKNLKLLKQSLSLMKTLELDDVQKQKLQTYLQKIDVALNSNLELLPPQENLSRKETTIDSENEVFPTESMPVMPLEVLVEILKYLSPSDLIKSASSICKYLNFAAHHPRLWQLKMQEYFPDHVIYSTLPKYQQFAEALKVRSNLLHGWFQEGVLPIECFNRILIQGNFAFALITNPSENGEDIKEDDEDINADNFFTIFEIAESGWKELQTVRFQTGEENLISSEEVPMCCQFDGEYFVTGLDRNTIQIWQNTKKDGKNQFSRKQTLNVAHCKKIVLKQNLLIVAQEGQRQLAIWKKDEKGQFVPNGTLAVVPKEKEFDNHHINLEFDGDHLVTEDRGDLKVWKKDDKGQFTLLQNLGSHGRSGLFFKNGYLFVSSFPVIHTDVVRIWKRNAQGQFEMHQKIPAAELAKKFPSDPFFKERANCIKTLEIYNEFVFAGHHGGMLSIWKWNDDGQLTCLHVIKCKNHFSNLHFHNDRLFMIAESDEIEDDEGLHVLNFGAAYEAMLIGLAYECAGIPQGIVFEHPFPTLAPDDRFLYLENRVNKLLPEDVAPITINFSLFNREHDQASYYVAIMRHVIKHYGTLLEKLELLATSFKRFMTYKGNWYYVAPFQAPILKTFLDLLPEQLQLSFLKQFEAQLKDTSFLSEAVFYEMFEYLEAELQPQR